MSHNDHSFIGGSIVSYKQQQRIDHELKAFEISLKHKKKKSKSMANKNESLDESRDFPYTHLLSRIFNELNPTQSHIASIPDPDIRLAGSKKSCYVNIIATCRSLKRHPNHLKKFIETELITNSNFNGDGQLMIRGRWRKLHIQSVLKSYVKLYILCEDCKSLNTTIDKNNSTRLYELKCNDCCAERTCKRIQKAFKTIANKRQRIELRQKENK